MASNMEFRSYLTQNADTIIINNQKAAVGNCTNIIPILNNMSISTTPILFKSIMTSPTVFDTPSDLKDTYLRKYININQLSTPEINY